MSSLSQFLKTSTMFGPSGFPYLPGQDVFGSGHFQIIAASGNFTVPPSVTAAGIRVRVHGAAGSGGAASNTSPGTKATGGAAGGLAVKIITGLSVGRLSSRLWALAALLLPPGPAQRRPATRANRPHSALIVQPRAARAAMRRLR